MWWWGLHYPARWRGHTQRALVSEAPIALMCTISLCCKFVLKRKSFSSSFLGLKGDGFTEIKLPGMKRELVFHKSVEGPRMKHPEEELHGEAGLYIQLNENEVVHGGM